MRVYCPAKDIGKSEITITDSRQLHHLLNVLRIKEGEALGVFDGNKEYECMVKAIAKDKISAKIIKVKTQKSSRGLEVTLACAIPKRVKIEYIIEKCTELEVKKIIPVITDRTIVKVEGERSLAKLKRWQKIAMEASQQSGRISFPEISQALKFNEVLSSVKEYDLALIPNLKTGNKSIKEVLANFNGKSVIIFIGPEGDFSEKEIKLAEKNGCQGVSLGDLVLKVDTAAIAIAAFLHFSYDI